jgi:hypothetical protein
MLFTQTDRSGRLVSITKKTTDSRPSFSTDMVENKKTTYVLRNIEVR